jgi:hypothetical protein
MSDRDFPAIAHVEFEALKRLLPLQIQKMFCRYHFVGLGRVAFVATLKSSHTDEVSLEEIAGEEFFDVGLDGGEVAGEVQAFGWDFAKLGVGNFGGEADAVVEGVNGIKVVGEDEGGDVNLVESGEVFDGGIVAEALEVGGHFAGAWVVKLVAEGDGGVGEFALEFGEFGRGLEVAKAFRGADGDEEVADEAEHFFVEGAGVVEPGGAGENQAGEAFGKAGGEVYGNGGAHGDAANDGAVDSEMVEEGEQIVGVCFEADLFGGAELRCAVAAGVEADEADAFRWFEEAKGLGHVGAEAVLKNEREPGAGFLEKERDVVVGEVWHYGASEIFWRMKRRESSTWDSARP